jgi:hypothetical protein
MFICYRSTSEVPSYPPTGPADKAGDTVNYRGTRRAAHAAIPGPHWRDLRGLRRRHQGWATRPHEVRRARHRHLLGCRSTQAGTTSSAYAVNVHLNGALLSVPSSAEIGRDFNLVASPEPDRFAATVNGNLSRSER